MRYHYDELNRLVREDNTYNEETTVFEYDTDGDILSEKKYNYTLADTPSGFHYTIDYGYNDPAWPNGMTSRDIILTFYNADGTVYEHGGNYFVFNDRRQLESVSGSVFYKYNSDGLLAERTSFGVTTEYYYSGTKLVKQRIGTDENEFYYDAAGRPYAMTYNGDVYYYIVDLFGDVLGIYDKYGTVVTKYVYDAWGYYVDVTGSMCNSIGFINPLRYRGYFFDEETGYYFLQSRWYEPETRRFLSADSYMVAGDHINSTNMFAYCLNNPVMYVDPSGREAIINTSNPVTAVFAIISCTLTCLDKDQGLGMSIGKYAFFLSACDNIGDAYYVSQVMLCGKNYGKNPDDAFNSEFVLNVNGTDLIKGKSFHVCSSFKNKRVCKMVAKYYTWVDGINSEEEVAAEIYSHAMIYYYSNSVTSIILDDGIIYDDESTSFEVAKYLIKHADPINLGGSRPIDKHLKIAYEFIWNHF